MILPTILTFGGPIASGKTTLSTRVAETLGWRRASFGGYIKDMARQQGIDPTRDNLQGLGKEEIDKGWDAFCAGVMRAAGWKTGQNLVVDGMRHLGALDSITKIAAPARVYLVYIMVDEKERQRRIRARGDGAVLTEQHEDHVTERQVATEIPERADIIVDGDGTIEDAARTVLDMVAAWNRCK